MKRKWATESNLEDEEKKEEDIECTNWVGEFSINHRVYLLHEFLQAEFISIQETYRNSKQLSKAEKLFIKGVCISSRPQN